MIRRWAVLLAVAGASAWAGAQAPEFYDARLRSSRTLDVRERSALEKGRLELGVVAGYEAQEPAFPADEIDLVSATPYLRLGLTRNTVISLAVPALYRDSDRLGSSAGPGDVRLGAEVLVYEDMFRYPYVLPYLEVTVPTGREADGLGEGDPTFRVGMALGTTRWRHWHFRMDGRFDAYQGRDNRASIGGALIWDVSDQFAVLAEGRVTQRGDDETTTRKLFLAGMVYRPTPLWSVNVHVGQEMDSERDVMGAVKVAFRLPPRLR